MLVWLAAAPLISWQMYSLERREHLPVAYHDLLLVCRQKAAQVVAVASPQLRGAAENP